MNALSMPRNVQPYAGAEGWDVYLPKPNDICWQTSPETGKLEAMTFDQYHFDSWTWLTGPEKWEHKKGYGKTRYIVGTPGPRREL